MANFVILDEKNRKEIREKNRDGVVMLLSYLHGMCTFSNMVIDINIARQSGKKRKKEQT